MNITTTPTPISSRRGFGARLALSLAACAGLAGCSGDAENSSYGGEEISSSSSQLTCITLRRLANGPTVDDATIAMDTLDSSRQYQSYGAETTFGTGSQGSMTRMGLLRFDLSTIPANVPVQSAVLDLAYAQGAGSGAVDLLRATAPWSESSVTWASFGAAYAPSILASFQPTQYAPGAHIAVTLTSTVQSWVDGTTPNDGLVLRESGNSHARFGASEAGNVGNRPALTVCYDPPTCADGLQNQGETGVDCGSPCVACPTCTDLIQNQGETGVDCGGPCGACPTCTDLIQNQGETGVDCGGPCAPCWVDPCLSVTCAALDACHVPGTCDSSTGQCDNPPAAQGTGCDDGNPCTSVDACDGTGTCLAGTPVSCSSAGACQLGSCDPQSGQCVYATLPDGASCSDANVCNGAETCLAGQCTAGTPPVYGTPPFFKDSALDVEPFVSVQSDGTIRAFATKQVIWNPYCNYAWWANQSPYYDRLTYLYDQQGNRTELPGIGSPAAIDQDSAGNTWTTTNMHDNFEGWYDWYWSEIVAYDPAGNAWSPPQLWLASTTSIGVDDAGRWVAAGADDYANFIIYQGYQENIEWTTAFGGYAAATSHLARSNAGHTLVPIAFAGTLSGPLGTFTSSPVVLEIDGAGSLVTSTTIGGPGTVTIRTIEVDDADAAYITGEFSGSVTFGATTLTSAGGTDAYVAKIVGGVFAWARPIGGAGGEQGLNLAVGPAGTVHVVGNFAQSVDFGAGAVAAPNGQASYVAEYDANGAYVSARSLHGVLAKVGIAVDCANNVILAGATSGSPLGVHGEAVDPEAGFITQIGSLADCGPGYCSGAQYCDACGCRPASDALSIAACACSLVDPLAGSGDCSEGIYCEGTHSASPQCYAQDSAANYLLCLGGDLNAQCLPNLPPKHVFVTSQTYSPSFGGAAGGDAICQSLAQAAGRPGTFKAWLSDVSGDAKDRIAHGFEPYELFDGTLVAASWSQLAGWGHVHPIDQTELGTPGPQVAVTTTWDIDVQSGSIYNSVPDAVWTGTLEGGVLAYQSYLNWDYWACTGPMDCSGWTGAGSGTVGSMTGYWSNMGFLSCATQLPLYCIEE